MTKPLMFSVFSLALLCTVGVTSVYAQTTSVPAMLERMQTIMSEMEKLQKEFQVLALQVQNGSSGSPAVLGAQTTNQQSTLFTESLEYGETNDDIKRIQKLLATDPEIYPYGVASGFFGPKTEEAIKNLQKRFGLDPVGAIGPATTALLEGYMRAYPNGNYPDGVLTTRPQVLGVSTPAPTTPSQGTTGNAAQIAQVLSSIKVTLDDGEASANIFYSNGTKKKLDVPRGTKIGVIEYLASALQISTASITAVVEFRGEEKATRSSRNDTDSNESDAEDALDDAEDALDDAEDKIEEADDDGDDVDWAEDTLDEADKKYKKAEDAYDDEDWDKAVALAKEAEKLAKKAISRIDEKQSGGRGDSDEIEEIEAKVKDKDQTTVTVTYEDGEDRSFKVEEDEEDDIIREVADELDMDEDDVADLIEFKYGSIDRIEVRIDSDRSIARVFYDSGVERRVRMNDTDEDDIVRVLAKELDVDEDDIDGITDFTD